MTLRNSLLICSLLIITMLSGCSGIINETPQDAFNRWLNYQKEENYEKAWAMVTKEVQERRGTRGFHVGIIEIGWLGEYEEFVEDKGLYSFGDESGDCTDLIKLVQKWDIKEEGNKATLKKIVPYKGLDWHLEAVLEKKDGQWLISDFTAMGKRPPGSDIFWID